MLQTQAEHVGVHVGGTGVGIVGGVEGEDIGRLGQRIVDTHRGLGQVDIVSIAQGKVVPSDHVKSIQPLQTAAIRSIAVREGQAVRAGDLLIEPKPQEPTKHQYDYDSATVFGFLQQFGLEHEIKVNIEANHATLSGHSFEHEIATAIDLGIFGSIDMNRGDMQCGWDTDQFPNNIPETALVMYLILQGGGFTTGGLNFDSKVRRQSKA